MYNTDTSVLHHGFLHEHKLTFYAKFSSWLKTARVDEHTSFFKALESDTEILDEDDVQKYILRSYYNSSNFNSTQNFHPEKGNYPPSLYRPRQPPYYKEWKSGNNQHRTSVGNSGGGDATTNALVAVLGQIMSAPNTTGSSNTTANNSNSTATVISNSTYKNKTITFKCQWSRMPICVIINGDVLNEKSKMIDILLLSGKYQSVNDKYNLDIEQDLSPRGELYFEVKCEDNEDNFVFSRDQFVDFSFDDIYGLENIKTPIRVNIITE